MNLKDSTLLKTRCFIDGAWVNADSGRTVDVLNPATGQTLGTVPDGGIQGREDRARRQAPQGGRYIFRADDPDRSDTGMLIAREEIFGPVAPIFRFKNESEAIRMANDTELGLAAYFYKTDLTRTFRVGEALEYGIVGINTGIIATEVAPFGGIKESGVGREGSKHGILDYTELKYMCIGGI